MTKLDEAIARLRALPRKDQDTAAEFVMEVITQNTGAIRLTPEQQAEVRRRLDRPAQLATHDQVRAYFKKQAV